MLETIEMGKHRNGEILTKTKLIPDPETAPIAQEYFERRVNFEPRKSILDDFHRRGIVSPSGNSEWAVATAKSMEDNIDVYLGHTIFNRINERVKVRGQLDGYVGGKKWKDKEEWVINENTHQPLITTEMGGVIRQQKECGLRDAPSNKQLYALSGILKCDICGSPYAGNSGYYRCNAKVMAGHNCENNAITMEKAEDAVFTLLGEHILKFKSIKPIIDEVKRKVGQSPSKLPVMEKRLKEIDKERKRLTELYQRGLIEIEEVEKELSGLNGIKAEIEGTIKEIRAQDDVVEVDDDTIRHVIETLGNQVKYADPKIRKQVALRLFKELRIGPKTGSPWQRKITATGIYLPLTAVSVASPRGFEPLSSA